MFLNCGVGEDSFFFFSVFQKVLLEPIIQSEVSQKDKDHYNILTNIYGI